MMTPEMTETEENMISLNTAYDFVSQHKELTGGEQFTLLSLIKFLGNNYREQIQVSVKKLSENTGISLRSIQRHMAKFEIRELVIVENTRTEIGTNGCNKYKIVGWAEWVMLHNT